MLKQIIFVSVLLVSIQHTLPACDVCGTNGGNMGLGLLSDYRSNFVRLAYFHNSFASTTEKGFPIRDRFDQYDVSLRYSLGKQKRLRLLAGIPVVNNTREIEQETNRNSGLSDIRLSSNYVLLSNAPLGKKISCHLELGGGLVLPVGEFDENIHDKNLPLHFNPGRGALAFVWQMNALFTREKSGLVFNQNYQWNMDSKSGYHFGNQLNAQMTVFREYPLKKISLIPNVGLGFENTTADSYANGKAVSGTGGKATFFSSAINIKTEKWLAGFSYATPLAQQYADSDLDIKGRITCQLSFIF